MSHSPPLSADPRAQKCACCGRLLYPGQVCIAQTVFRFPAPPPQVTIMVSAGTPEFAALHEHLTAAIQNLEDVEDNADEHGEKARRDLAALRPMMYLLDAAHAALAER